MNSLYMVLLGCRPKGRLTEQHDIFFGIGKNIKSLISEMKASWPEAKGQIHIDAWQKISQIDGYDVNIISKDEQLNQKEKLFFINLGGYKENEFEEFHYKIITVAASKSEAIKKSKQNTFFKHYGFAGAVSHIDDKYGIDVDDFYAINDILSSNFKNNFQIQLTENKKSITNEMHIGYLNISKI